MMRSLFSAVQGLRSHQTRMDVIGNNIANVNTHGFKKSRVTFGEVYNQTVGSASEPSASAGRGGINSKQIGLGVNLSSIDLVMTEGGLQSTGRELDLAISGSGFFTVKEGNTVLYTRTGNFSIDRDNYLVNPSGQYVQGWNATGSPPVLPGTMDKTSIQNIQIPDSINNGTSTVNLVQLSIDRSGQITGTYDDGSLYVIAKIGLAKFSNPNGLKKEADNNWGESANSGSSLIGQAGTIGLGKVISNNLEMSNVDLTEEFTNMIVTQRGFQANSKIISASDELLQDVVNLKR